MPISLAGRISAIAYLLAVIVGAVLWVTQGATTSAVLTTMILTLPFSPVAYVVVVTVALFLSSSPAGPVVVATLILVAFPSLALANVVLTGAARHAYERRRQRRPGAPTG